MPSPMIQEFGEEPLDVRESDHYHAEYVQSFVEKWDQLIDWDARKTSEGSFFVDLLRRLGKTKILDVATGTGFHSVQLLRAGFEVTSADGNAEMLGKAFANARKRGFVLRTIHADWRWLNRDVHDKYDAIICLGNSFTHLFDERDRRRALAEFYAALRHDGVLILDQRNYDAILDHGFQSKHKFYYCGDQVTAEPEHMDEGLARFQYDFPDGSTFHLNMFPLRREYVRRLLTEVGFQGVETYGDFQETYREEEPDFLIHVASKAWSAGEDPGPGGAADRAEAYYDSADADQFYFNIWGGEDIHVGIYESPTDPIAAASARTVERLAERLELSSAHRVLDLGAGYGGAARHLARQYNCHVTALNLSEIQNARNRELSDGQGLAERIHVVHGNFESLPFPDDCFDVVWSQDSILHSGRRGDVLAEARRVLRPGGQLIFTDPMQADDCPPGVLQPVYDRIHLESLGSFAAYRELAREAGFELVGIEDLSEQLTRHYTRVREELQSRYDEMCELASRAYVDRMIAGLGHWIDAGQAGHLAWGILHFRVPDES